MGMSGARRAASEPPSAARAIMSGARSAMVKRPVRFHQAEKRPASTEVEDSGTAARAAAASPAATTGMSRRRGAWARCRRSGGQRVGRKKGA